MNDTTSSEPVGQADETQAAQAWADTRVPTRHARAVEAGFVSTDTNWSETYCEILRLLGSGATIAIVGQNGTGRTMMGVGALNAAAGAGWRGLYVHSRDALDVLSDQHAVEAASRIFNSHLLVVDNVAPLTPYEEILLSHAIDIRHGKGLDTLLILTRGPSDGFDLDGLTVRACLGSDIAGKIVESGRVFSLWRALRHERGAT